MSTRDEILEALTENPEGLTTKELAPKCPAADCDEMIVGRTIAMLSHEHVIHRGTELRAGGVVWIFGKDPKTEPPKEAPVSLAGADQQAKPNISAAALAIAALRTPKTAAGQTSSRAPKPETATTSAPAAAPQEVVMKPKTTVAERVVEALKKHGRCTVEQLARHADTTKATLYTMLGTLKKHHGVVSTERGIYELGDKAAPPPKATPAKERAMAPKNGSGVYAAAVLDLQERRADLVAEIEKVDHAIKAMEALAA